MLDKISKEVLLSNNVKEVNIHVAVDSYPKMSVIYKDGWESIEGTINIGNFVDKMVDVHTFNSFKNIGNVKDLNDLAKLKIPDFFDSTLDGDVVYEKVRVKIPDKFDYIKFDISSGIYQVCLNEILSKAFKNLYACDVCSDMRLVDKDENPNVFAILFGKLEKHSLVMSGSVAANFCTLSDLTKYKNTNGLMVSDRLYISPYLSFCSKEGWLVEDKVNFKSLDVTIKDGYYVINVGVIYTNKPKIKVLFKF